MTIASDHPARPARPARAGAGATPQAAARSAALGDRPASGSAETTRSRIVVTLFLASLVLPFTVTVSGLLLSPVRVLLLIVIVPAMMQWAAGKCGRITSTDVLVLLFSFWVVVALFIIMGPSIIQFAGITVVEILGSYFVARHYIRSIEDMRHVIRVMAVLLLLMLPGAISEAVFSYRLYDKVFSMLGSTFPWRPDPRWGMMRAQVSFEHPILYGVFCSTMFSLFWFSMRRNGQDIARLRKAWLAIAATFFSLSTGAFLGLIIQSLLIGWNWVLKALDWRWYLLCGLTALAYVVVDIGSNRTPFEVFISYLTFNSHNSYWRVLIFTYAMDDVMGSPFFGIGLNYWSRPDWMYSASVDNFWLLMAMRYGIPSLIFIFAAYVTAIVRATQATLVTEEARHLRMAYVFVMIGIGISMATVHLWGATFAHFCFFLGFVAWMNDPGDADGAGTAAAPDAGDGDGDGPGVRLTRAENRHVRRRQ